MKPPRWPFVYFVVLSSIVLKRILEMKSGTVPFERDV